MMEIEDAPPRPLCEVCYTEEMWKGIEGLEQAVDILEMALLDAGYEPQPRLRLQRTSAGHQRIEFSVSGLPSSDTVVEEEGGREDGNQSQPLDRRTPFSSLARVNSPRGSNVSSPQFVQRQEFHAHRHSTPSLQQYSIARAPRTTSPVGVGNGNGTNMPSPPYPIRSAPESSAAAQHYAQENHVHRPKLPANVFTRNEAPIAQNDAGHNGQRNEFSQESDPKKKVPVTTVLVHENNVQRTQIPEAQLREANGQSVRNDFYRNNMDPSQSHPGFHHGSKFSTGLLTPQGREQTVQRVDLSGGRTRRPESSLENVRRENNIHEIGVINSQRPDVQVSTAKSMTQPSNAPVAHHQEMQRETLSAKNIPTLQTSSHQLGNALGTNLRRVGDPGPRTSGVQSPVQADDAREPNVRSVSSPAGPISEVKVPIVGAGTHRTDMARASLPQSQLQRKKPIAPKKTTHADNVLDVEIVEVEAESDSTEEVTEPRDSVRTNVKKAGSQNKAEHPQSVIELGDTEFKKKKVMPQEVEKVEKFQKPMATPERVTRNSKEPGKIQRVVGSGNVSDRPTSKTAEAVKAEPSSTVKLNKSNRENEIKRKEGKVKSKGDEDKEALLRGSGEIRLTIMGGSDLDDEESDADTDTSFTLPSVA